MVSLRRTLQCAHEALNKNNIDHALIGGFALAVHGVNRATADIDLLIHGNHKESAKTALITAGFKLDFETTEVLHFSGNGFLDVLLANRPLSQAMLQNAKTTSPLKVKSLSAEDIIGLKVQAYKNQPKRELQDKADIQSLIEKNPSLDWERIKKYADLFGEWDAIQNLRGKK